MNKEKHSVSKLHIGCAEYLDKNVRECDQLLQQDLPFVPVELHEEIARTIQEEVKRERHIQQRQHFRRSIATVAILLMLCIGIYCVHQPSVEAFFHSIYQMVFQQMEESNDINFIETTPHIEIPTTWKAIWYPTYLPRDFTLQSAEETGDDIKKLIFQNPKGEFIILKQCSVKGGKISIDNEMEASDTGKIELKESTASYWHKKNGKTELIWQQGGWCLLLISDQFTLEELVEIADSVSYQQLK